MADVTRIAEHPVVALREQVADVARTIGEIENRVDAVLSFAAHTCGECASYRWRRCWRRHIKVEREERACFYYTEPVP